MADKLRDILPAYGDRTSQFRFLTKDHTLGESSPITVWRSALAASSASIEQQSFGGGGISRHASDALFAALYESVERLCWANGNIETIRESVSRSDQEWFKDRLSILPHFTEVELHELYADTEIVHDELYDSSLWTLGRSLVTNDNVWIPLALALPRHTARVKSQAAIDMTTNGMAAGSSFAGATLSGLMEALERHTFLEAHYNARTFDVVRPSRLSPSCLQTFRAIADIFDQVLLATIPGPLGTSLSVCSGYVGGSTGTLRLRIGASLNFDYSVAVEKSILEFAQCAVAARGKTLHEADSCGDWRNVPLGTLLDHVSLGDYPDYCSRLKFRTPEEQNCDDTPMQESASCREFDQSDVIDLCRRLEHSFGINAVVVPFTPESIVDTTQCSVVRVVLLGAIPLRVGRAVGLDSQFMSNAGIDSNGLAILPHCFP